MDCIFRSAINSLLNLSSEPIPPLHKMFSPYPNPKLGHSNWDQLKEIDVLASTRELFIPAISSIIEKADGHCKFNEDTVLIFLVDTVLIHLLKDFMTDEDVDYQLTPAGLHRRNWAERAIQTFKNHFIAGLCR
jgi:hypothetical protein